MARIIGQANWSAPGVAIRELTTLLARVGVHESEYRHALMTVRSVLEVRDNQIAALRYTIEQVVAKLEQAEGRPSHPGTASGVSNGPEGG